MAKIFAVTLILIAIGSAIPIIMHTWPAPADISTHGPLIDEQMTDTMAEAGISFLASQILLAIFVWKYSNRAPGAKIGRFPGGAMGLVIAAFLLVGTEVLALGAFGARAWAGIYFKAPAADAMPVQVQAGQFAFYFRYPGPDGKFGPIHPDQVNEGSQNFFGSGSDHDLDAKDDIVTAELAIPVEQGNSPADALERCWPLVLCARVAGAAGFRSRPGSIVHFTANQGRQVRDRMYATLRSGSLQHEGVSRRDVASRTSMLAEAASQPCSRGIAGSGTRTQDHGETIL